MKSIFTDKSKEPSIADLKKALGKTFEIWNKLVQFTKSNAPDSNEGWNYSGDKYGWSYRVSDNKRVLIYLLPRDQFFKVAFVFGQTATHKIQESNIAEEIKNELKAAKAYAEGRGIRIEIRDKTNIKDIQQLIKIKLL